MAWVQSRNGSWRVLFRHHGKQHTFWVGEVSRAEAEAVAAKVDYWLMRLKQGLVALPPGCGVAAFVQNDGRPPTHSAAGPERQDLTLAALRDRYLGAAAAKLEATTLGGTRLHFGHLVRLLRNGTLVAGLTRADHQGYVDRRAG